MNKTKLIAIMQTHELDRYQVADILGIRKTRVDAWLASETSTGFRNMPDNMIELLELKLNN